MKPLKGPDGEDCWLSITFFHQWLLRGLLTWQGLVATTLTGFVALLFFDRIRQEPWLAIVGILPLTIATYIAQLALMFIALISDIFAAWVMTKFFREPRMSSAVQNLTYFALSCVGLVIAALIFGGPDVPIGYRGM